MNFSRTVFHRVSWNVMYDLNITILTIKCIHFNKYVELLK
jgi:hypothetical protein